MPQDTTRFWSAVHAWLEMLPISSSTHLALCISSDTNAPNIYAAHVLPAAIFAVYAGHVVCVHVRARAWSTLWQWVVCGAIAEFVTATVYFASWCTPVQIALHPVWGIGITSGLLWALMIIPRSSQPTTVPTRDASVVIGCAQAFAFIPGVSRLAITYTTARFCGWSHSCAFMFACALAVPLSVGYWLLEVYAHSSVNVPTMHEALWYLGVIGVGYALLWCTDYLLATGRAWIFAAYLLAFSSYLLLGAECHNPFASQA